MKSGTLLLGDISAYFTISIDKGMTESYVSGLPEAVTLETSTDLNGITE